MNKKKLKVAEYEPKNLSESDFIKILDKGKKLIVEYEYEKRGQLYYILYEAWKLRKGYKNIYILAISEGEKELGTWYTEEASERDFTKEFKTPKDLLNFLKKNEYFKAEDWHHSE